MRKRKQEEEEEKGFWNTGAEKGKEIKRKKGCKKNQ